MRLPPSRDKRLRPVPANEKPTPVVVVPEQTTGTIQRRREIRETFHDSKARVIRGRKR